MQSKLLLILALFTISFSVIAQENPIDDTFGWSFIKLEGKLDSDINPKAWNSKFLGMIEYHYRLNENVSKYQNMIIRPMLGYVLNDQAKVWVGYAYIEMSTANGIVREQRLFQMMTYNSDKSKPIVFVGRTKIEERFFENSDQMTMRIRQMIGVMVSLFKIEETKVLGYITNEYHMGMKFNGGVHTSFNQYRVLIGIGVNTQIGGRSVKFKAGYLNITSPHNMTHGFTVGATINLNKRKKKKKY